MVEQNPIRPLPELTAGDQMPNFVLPNLAGEHRMFYERVSGKRNLLILANRPDDTALALLADFAKLRQQFQALNVDMFAVVPARPGIDDQRLVSQDPPYLVFLDINNMIVPAMLAKSGLVGDRPACILMDENQRIVQILQSAADAPHDLAAEALGFFKACGPPPPKQILNIAAPVLVLPNVVDPDICRLLIERWETEGHKDQGVRSVVDGEEVVRTYLSLKKSLDHLIYDDDLLGGLIDIVGRRVAPQIAKYAHFEGFKFDRFFVARYDAERGDYFRPHRDNQAPSTQDRLFGISINLNSEDYEGGELYFPEYGPHGYKPDTGGAVVFSGSLIHEAVTPRRGKRFALLSFLRDTRRPA